MLYERIFLQICKRTLAFRRIWSAMMFVQTLFRPKSPCMCSCCHESTTIWGQISKRWKEHSLIGSTPVTCIGSRWHKRWKRLRRNLWQKDLNIPEYILNEVSTSEQCCIMFYNDVLCISFNIQDVNLTKGFDSRSSSQKGENYQGCPEADVEEFDDLADGAILAVPWHDHRNETGRLRRTKLIQKAQKRTWKNQVLQECRNPYFGHWKKDQSMDLFVAAKVIRLMPLHTQGRKSQLRLYWTATAVRSDWRVLPIASYCYCSKSHKLTTDMALLGFMVIPLTSFGKDVLQLYAPDVDPTNSAAGSFRWFQARTRERVVRSRTITGSIGSIEQVLSFTLSP